MPKNLFAKMQIHFSQVFYFCELLKHRPLGLFVYLKYILLEFYFILHYIVYKKPCIQKVTECFVYLYRPKKKIISEKECYVLCSLNVIENGHLLF